jgi:hypothetical protein
MRPKKKHFKKVIAYIKQNEPKERINHDLLNQIINIGIAHQLPVTLGQTVRDMIVLLDYNIHRSSFVKFVMFLESCKGFEEDAIKFLILAQKSSHL